MLKDRRGEVIEFVAIVLPLLIFMIYFTLTYGFIAFSKSTLTTATAQTARTYAIAMKNTSEEEMLALEQAKETARNYMLLGKDYFDPDNDMTITMETHEVSGIPVEYVVARLESKVPVIMPGVMKFIGLNDMIGEEETINENGETTTRYVVHLSSTARYVNEYRPATSAEE